MIEFSVGIFDTLFEVQNDIVAKLLTKETTNRGVVLTILNLRRQDVYVTIQYLQTHHHIYQLFHENLFFSSPVLQ